jgi:hypothetical protein
LTNGKILITLAMPFLIVASATGSSAYLQLTSHNPSLWLAADLSGGVINPPDNNPLWRWLASDPYRETLRLQVPGFWTWRDEYHANASGHFLTLFAVWMIAELFFIRRTNAPWLAAVLIPVFAVLASAWALPITLLLCGGGILIALCCGYRPVAWRTGLLILGGMLLVLWPAFYSATSSPEVPPTMVTKPEWQVPLQEFLVQWWPIILLWICGVLAVRRLSPGIVWVLIVVPMMLIGIEHFTIESRYNTVEKMWGYTYGAALVALFPLVANRRRIFERTVTYLLLFSALCSLWGFVRGTLEANKDDRWHLEGDHYLTSDGQKRDLLLAMFQTKGATYLTGKTVWCYNEAPALSVFTGNMSYSAWSYFESLTNYKDEASGREKRVNDFYSGAMMNRLQFLEDNRIAGVVIWPEDAIPDDALAVLTKELAPGYTYVDCRGTGDKNAGLFRRRPGTEGGGG